MEVGAQRAAQIGNLVLTLFLTSVFVQLIVGPMVDKFGYKPVAIVGFFVEALAMYLIGSASSLGTATAACVLLGSGAMCLNTVGNTLIPVVLFDGKDPARASNFGNAFFGLGYVVTPLLFSLLGSAGMSYKTGVFILCALLALFLLVALSASFPKVATDYQFSMAFKLLGTPAVIVAALALFCYISLAFGGFTAVAVAGGYADVPPDSREKAIVSVSGATRLLAEEDLVNVTVPTLHLGGTKDDVVPIAPTTWRAFDLIATPPADHYRVDIIGAGHYHFANICDIGDALIGLGIPKEQWSVIGAGALLRPHDLTCVPPTYPIEEAQRLQNLYTIAFFRLYLFGQTTYARYLTRSYAALHEPDVRFFRESKNRLFPSESKSAWWQCIPEPLIPNKGFGMNEAIKPCCAAMALIVYFKVRM